MSGEEEEAWEIVEELTPSRNSCEIGHLAVWTVTSSKPGNGVDLLRDGRDDTYWQSDGVQPHFVNIQFQRKVYVTEIAIRLDYKLDESYTPNRLSIRAGTSFHDLREIKIVTLDQVSGWVMIPLEPPDHPGLLKAFFIQLAIVSNHQNGRDTHLRQVKLYGPLQQSRKLLGHHYGLQTTDFAQFATVR